MIKNLVYDVGLNNGDDTAYYLSQGYRVVAIEANPILAEQSSHRFEREISSEKLIILNIGVSDKEGSFPFYVCDNNPEWSTFDQSVAKDKNVGFHQVTVSCRRFRSILEEFGTPYFLKLDIEGDEIYCLRDLIASDLPEFISFEKTKQWSVESLTLLHDLGYTGFKLISQSNYLPVEYPLTWEHKRCQLIKNLLNNKNIFLRIFRKIGARGLLLRQLNRTRYRPDGSFFPLGSSGSFGEDTAGRWQTYEDIIDTLTKANSYFDARESSVFWDDASFSFWADFHVKK